MTTVTESFGYKQISATGNIRAGAGQLGGIFVSSASGSPTIAIYDDAATGTTTKLVDTFIPVAGYFYPMPFGFSAGCYIVIGGTVSATVAFL